MGVHALFRLILQGEKELYQTALGGQSLVNRQQ